MTGATDDVTRCFATDLTLIADAVQKEEFTLVAGVGGASAVRSADSAATPWLGARQLRSVSTGPTPGWHEVR